MSGVKGVIDLITDIVRTLDSVDCVSSSTRDGSKLPTIFYDVNGSLPLVKDTLQVATGCLTHCPADEASCKALSVTLENCMDKAVVLQGIYRRAARPGQSGLALRETALLALSNANKVAILMKAILEDTQLVAGHSILKSTTEQHIEKLSQSIVKFTATISSTKEKEFEERTVGHFQHVEFSGTGDQILGFDQARQFIGTTQHFSSV